VDSVSYLIGSSFAKNLSESMPEVNIDLMLEGLKDNLFGENPRLEDEFDLLITQYFQDKQIREGEQIKSAGEKYLDSIKKSNPKIIKTSTGLMYEVLKSSKGKTPIETDMVRVHYKGSTPSGEVFDSSYDRGEPIDFTLNQVIKGWAEGVQLMTVGSKYRFYIPQDLAYGEMAPPGSVIKPFMPLVFEVELIDIIK
jgi:FKBP-type peptidyl-prolyl cis-trans isomerase